MIGSKLNNYCGEHQIESIYCLGDTELGSSRPPHHARAAKCQKKPYLARVKVEVK